MHLIPVYADANKLPVNLNQQQFAEKITDLTIVQFYDPGLL